MKFATIILSLFLSGMFSINAFAEDTYSIAYPPYISLETDKADFAVDCYVAYSESEQDLDTKAELWKTEVKRLIPKKKARKKIIKKKIKEQDARLGLNNMMHGMKIFIQCQRPNVDLRKIG